MTASSGVVIAAAITVGEASPGAMSSPKVPTMIDTGRAPPTPERVAASARGMV